MVLPVNKALALNIEGRTQGSDRGLAVPWSVMGPGPSRHLLR